MTASVIDNGRWVGRDMAQRFRAEYGVYAWWEYREFAAAVGVRLLFHDRMDIPIACHYDRTVFVRQNSTAQLLARRVWHELVHIVALPCNHLYWETRPFGIRTIAKLEQRVEDFVTAFPVWDE